MIPVKNYTSVAVTIYKLYFVKLIFILLFLVIHFFALSDTFGHFT